jgi:hypothetical protein
MANARVPVKKPPANDSITLQWLAQVVPVYWWWVLMGAIGGLLVAAFQLGTAVAAASASYQLRQVNEDKDRVLGEIQQLEVKKANLEAAAVRLEADAHSRSLTKEQIIEELRKQGELRD